MRAFAALTIFVIFFVTLTGCETFTDTSVTPKAAENYFPELTEQLNARISSYVGQYEQTKEVHFSSRFGSGASDYTDVSKILFELENGKVTTYTHGYSRPNGFPHEYEYVEYYNESSGELCKIVKNRKFRDCPDPYDSTSCDLEKLCPDPNFCNLVMVDEKTCNISPPADYDFSVKQEILKYLTENNITSIEKKEQTGTITCYSTFYRNLEQKFCFDISSFLTHAVWGENISTENRTHIIINTLNKKN